MRTIWLGLILIVSLVLQGLFKLPYAPDFVLVFMAAVAVLASDQELISYSFLGGLFQDALYSANFSATLLKTLAGWGLIQAKKNIDLEPLRLAYGLVVVATPLMILGETLVFRLFYPGPMMTFDLGAVTLHIIFTTIFNLLLTPLYFKIISHLIA